MSSPAVDEPITALGSWCGLTWRRSSENEGPGSILGENSGNALGSAIERGAYSRHSTPQRNRPPPHNCRELVIAGEIADRGRQAVFVIRDVADGDVAVEAQDAANATG